MDESAPESPIPDQPRVTDSVRVQILATEHWSLLATRSMTWNEIFTRASMFLTTLSAAVVALALVAQASDFGDNFRAFALLVLPVVLFLGIGTYIRLGDAMAEDVWMVVGMNRLRHAYIEIAPDLEPYFVTAHHDDVRGLMQSYGPFTRIRPSRIMAGTPTIVGVLDSVLVGVIVALFIDIFSDRAVLYTTLGVIVAISTAVVMIGVIPFRSIGLLQRELHPRFPSEDAPPVR